jgi:hypothetical protein
MPHRTWTEHDRGRYSRSSTAIDDPFEVFGFTERDGSKGKARGYQIESGVNQNQLEVCRLCGKDLELPEGEREKGNPPEFCSDRCKKDVKNARARAKRTVARPPKIQRLPDLTTIHVAGVGDMRVDPSEWNRMQPRRDPKAFQPRAERRTMPWLFPRSVEPSARSSPPTTVPATIVPWSDSFEIATDGERKRAARMLIENWSAEDREAYCGGEYVKAQRDYELVAG